MPTPSAALYYGQVVHQRLRPARHRLSYRVFSLFADLDALPGLAGRLRLFSHNRFNLFSFHDRDHGTGRGGAVRSWVEGQLAAAGLPGAGATIRVLCYPRILGYVFNPLTVYFCHEADGRLGAILYEVNNTFGERHSYLIPVAQEHGGAVRQLCSKAFYVSPFNRVAGSYRFRIVPPAETVGIVISHHDADGPLLHAAFRGRRGPLTDRALALAFVRYPLMTLKVVAGIHWEALRLWRKGLRVVRRPRPPDDAVTIVKTP